MHTRSDEPRHIDTRHFYDGLDQDQRIKVNAVLQTYRGREGAGRSSSRNARRGDVSAAGWWLYRCPTTGPAKVVRLIHRLPDGRVSQVVSISEGDCRPNDYHHYIHSTTVVGEQVRLAEVAE